MRGEHSLLWFHGIVLVRDASQVGTQIVTAVLWRVTDEFFEMAELQEMKAPARQG